MKKLTGILIALLTICLILSVPAFATESTGETASLATPTLVGASLSLEDRVHIWFALYIGEDATATTEYGMIFWTAEKTNEADYTMENAEKDGATIVKGSESHAASVEHPELGTLQVREFDYSVAAKEMTDMVYARGYIKTGDQYTYTKMVPYSVQTYAGNMLGIYPGTTKTDDEALVEMIETMLHFGAALQKYFKYRTDDLADTILKWSKGLAYTDNGDGTCSVSGIGECKDTDVYIPKIALNGDCAGMKVTSIGDRAFYCCSSLTSITIPNSVTSIGAQAFEGCSSLTSITIPNSVTSIGYGAFYRCSSLTCVTIPNSVTSIDWMAFEGCSSLTSITIPNSVTSIGGYAFCGCTGLTSITIPNSVTSIGNRAFRGCTGLTSVTVDAQNTVYHSADNCIIATASKTLIAGCKTSVIPTDGSVTSIDGGAFSDCSGLTNIAIPDSVTSIRYTAFQGCTGLASIAVDVKNSVYHSKDNCIIETASKTLVVGCKNSVIPTDGSVTSIGWFAFDGCTGLTSITIPDGTSIGFGAFYDCSSLTSVTIPNSVTSIDSSVFSGCKGLTSITFGENSQLTSIGGSAFFGCSNLTSITIPDSVTSIGGSAFSACTSLTSITIPDSVTSIGEYAFNGCSSLTSVHITDIASWCNTNFSNSFSNPLCYAHNLYLNDELVTNLVIPDSVTIIGNYAFDYCTSLTSITIPNSVTSIGRQAFDNCTGLTSITFGENSQLSSIDWYAFRGCSSLTSITIPDSVTSIGNYAFSGCSSLTSITIPDSVTNIGNYAFSGCSSLTSVYVTDIASWCNIKFSSSNSNPLCYADNLYLNDELVTNLVIPDSVTSIGDFAFYGCTGLTRITIGNSVTSIGSYAFCECSGLTSITIPNSVTSMGESAFQRCYKLIEVYNLSKLNISIDSTGNGYVGYYAKNIYTATTGASKVWTNSDGYIFYEDGNTCYLMSYTGGDTVLTLPESCNGKNYAIYGYAFSYCSSLTSITIPNSVTYIGSSAFYDCTGLTSITIPDSVTSIGWGAFYYCRSLTNITYIGTKARWSAIGKWSNWDSSTGTYTVHCTDGDIAK